ncbi:Poly(A)-specific ribonuclease PARN [Durusdinium trenchii]|uniref:Poly(A)-specific ribonuclease PARN n=1 Tax=Durusdinium trenchii TaxID=1381693 RepID=A0ABP0HUN7_9DINO
MDARRLALALACLGAAYASEELEECQNVGGKSKCAAEVLEAMLEGFAQNPKKFVGLTVHSTYSEFQAYFHNAGMHDCPRPCLPHEEPCVKFGPNYPGMADVVWARNDGMVNHPEWYPELSSKSSNKEIAKALYMHGVKKCKRICEDDEEEGHFEPIKKGPSLEGWMTTTTVKGQKLYPSTPTAAPTTAPSVATTVAPTVAPTAAPTVPLVVLPTPPTAAPTVAPTEAPTVAVTTPPTAAPTLAPATTTPKALTAAPTMAPTTTINPVIEEHDCGQIGRTFSMLDFVGHLPVQQTSSAACRAHCEKFPEAAYFNYYVPLSTCHCPPSDTLFEKALGKDYIGGKLDCKVEYVKRIDSNVPEVSYTGNATSGFLLVAGVMVAAASSLAVVFFGHYWKQSRQLRREHEQTPRPLLLPHAVSEDLEGAEDLTE